MTSNTNRMLIPAAVLAVGAILSSGGVTTAHAGSNDGGPFRYITQSSEPGRAGAAAYTEARSNVQSRNTKRARVHATPDAYGSYAASRDLVPSAPVKRDFPRGAQGGW